MTEKNISMDEKSKKKRKEICISTKLEMITLWLWKLHGYKIDENLSKIMDYLLRNNFRISWNNLTDNQQLNFDEAIHMIENLTVYVINNKEGKEWRYFNEKGKGKYDGLILLKQKSIFSEKNKWGDDDETL
jgi:hypothetical protein